MHVVSVAVAALFLAACNTSDPRIVDAAETLVPPESEIIELRENTGLSPEVGQYSASLTITDGGLGVGLLEAIEEQAAAEGWEPTYRRESPGGFELGYLRDGLQADVDVRTKKETIDAAIRVAETTE